MEDDGWSEYFAAHLLRPLRVSYEDDLERDPTATVTAVLHHVGVAPPGGWQAPVSMHRQADELNEEWINAYRRERSQRGGRSEAVGRNAG